METRDKFTIAFTDHGMIVSSSAGVRVEFTASEALMLLEILRAEEAELTRKAEAASPLPIRFRRDPNEIA